MANSVDPDQTAPSVLQLVGNEYLSWENNIKLLIFCSSWHLKSFKT